MGDIEPIYRVIGQRIQIHRKEHRPLLSQEDVARRIGLPRSAISAIEGGRQRILTHSLIKICEVLDITPNDLLEGVTVSHAEIKVVQADAGLKKGQLAGISRMIKANKLAAEEIDE